MTSSIDQVVARVAHARAVPSSAREQFASRSRTDRSSRSLLLETCHRVELYAANSGETTKGIDDHLPDGAIVLRGEAAVRHALSVAVGRDSIVIGEDQVLHQLRQALAAARAGGALDPILDRLFSLALRAGRRARSWQQHPSRSLADLAIERLEGSMGGLTSRHVLIVGSGEMGRLAASAAGNAGASVSVASRSPERASVLARATGARVEDFDPGRRAHQFAGIVVALRGPWDIAAETIEGLAVGPTLIVDLSVPSALPERLVAILRDRVTTADDLARGTDESHPTSERMLARLDRLVEETAHEFRTWLEGRERRAAASALIERADAEREAELADLWRRLPDLDAQARATIEGMSRHLAARLLREPLERLGMDSDGRHERAVRELWAL